MKAVNGIAEEHWIESRDGVRLLRRRWPAETPRGNVLIVHGYAEHSGRYHHVAAALNAIGLSVAALDLRGHGRSGGIRGHVGRFEEYHNDVASLMDSLPRQNEGNPLFLLGHSNGGLIALSYVLDRRPDLRGLIISSPFLGTAIKVPAAKLMLGRFLAAVRPSMAIPSGLLPRDLSRDASVGEAYAADPLVFSTVTPGYFTAAEAAQKRVQAEAGNIEYPCPILQAEADRIANPTLSRPLFEKLGSKDKRYIGYPGFYHEVFNENGKERVLADLTAWIAERL